MTADHPKPPCPPPLRAALRPTFSAKRDLGEVAKVSVREDHLALVFNNGVQLEFAGDLAQWVAQLDAAVRNARSSSNKEG